MSACTYHSPTIRDMVGEGGSRVPWLLCSLTAHALLFLVLSLVVFDTPQEPVREAIHGGVVIDPIPPIIDNPPPPAPPTSPLEPGDPGEVGDPECQDPLIEGPGDPDPEPFPETPADELLGEPSFAHLGFISTASLRAGDGNHFGARRRGTPGRRGPDGETPGSRAAVDGGLRWLADHQSEDGSWDSDGFHEECQREGREGDVPHPPCDGAASMEWSDPGNTGLALLAFLGAGHTHLIGPYRDVVRRGLRYLRGVQSPDGCVGPKEGHYMYNHAIAALALCEAKAMSPYNPLLRDSAQRAIDYLALAQNPGLGWRYSERCGDNDTSVTAWVVLALKSGRAADLRVPKRCFRGALTWIDRVTEDSYCKVGYRTPGDPGALLPEVQDRFESTETMTAAGILSRIFLGAKPEDPAVRGGVALLLDQLPEWNEEQGTINTYYWYYGTLAMFQVGGKPWRRWNQALQGALVETRCLQGPTAGSWDPVGAWGGAGGRVYATAINTLTLEIYYRYARVFR